MSRGLLGSQLKKCRCQMEFYGFAGVKVLGVYYMCGTTRLKRLLIKCVVLIGAVQVTTYQLWFPLLKVLN